MIGRKKDAMKLRYDLIPFRELESVVRVLTFGAQKYDDDNWKRLPNLRTRYLAACLRHVCSWAQGERYDSESGESHLAHAICCLLFCMWGDNGNNHRRNRHNNLQAVARIKVHGRRQRGQ